MSNGGTIWSCDDAIRCRRFNSNRLTLSAGGIDGDSTKQYRRWLVHSGSSGRNNHRGRDTGGAFYSFGDTPSITALKLVQNAGNRYSYYVYASMAANPSMSIRATGPTGFIWKELFTSTTDPGADSSTVKAATSMFSVNSPATFSTGVRATTFLTGWSWITANGYGLEVHGGAISANYISLRANNISGSSPELLLTSTYTALRRNDGTTNSLYIDNATGVITVDYSLNISSAATIRGVNPSEFAQLANINSVSISTTQKGYRGALNQNVHSTSSPTFTALTFGTLSAGAAPFSCTLSGTSFSGNLIGGTGSFSGNVTFGGITNISNTTGLANNSNTLSSSSGALSIAGDLHLYNVPNSPRIVFPVANYAAPTFATRSDGLRIIVTPAIGGDGLRNRCRALQSLVFNEFRLAGVRL